MPQVNEIVVVCDPFFRDIFEGLVSISLLLIMVLVERSLSFFGCPCLIEYEESIDVDLKFALPGIERQDSVLSGLQVCTSLFP